MNEKRPLEKKMDELKKVAATEAEGKTVEPPKEEPKAPEVKVEKVEKEPVKAKAEKKAEPAPKGEEEEAPPEKKTPPEDLDPIIRARKKKQEAKATAAPSTDSAVAKALEKFADRLPAQPEKKEEPKAADPIPDPILEPEQFQKWLSGVVDTAVSSKSKPLEQNFARIMLDNTYNEWGRMKQKLSSEDPHFKSAMDFLEETIAVTMFERGYTEDQVRSELKIKMLEEIDDAHQRGFRTPEHLADYLKLIAKKSGHTYTPPAPEVEEEEEDLDTRRQVKERLTTTAGIPNRGAKRDAKVTVDDYGRMNNRQRAELSKEQIRDLLKGKKRKTS